MSLPLQYGTGISAECCNQAMLPSAKLRPGVVIVIVECRRGSVRCWVEGRWREVTHIATSRAKKTVGGGVTHCTGLLSTVPEKKEETSKKSIGV